jgi:pilus assembly protein CpaE
MLAEVSANNRTNEVYRMIGMHVTGRNTPERASSKTSSFKLPSFLKKRA